MDTDTAKAMLVQYVSALNAFGPPRPSGLPNEEGLFRAILAAGGKSYVSLIEGDKAFDTAVMLVGDVRLVAQVARPQTEEERAYCESK